MPSYLDVCIKYSLQTCLAFTDPDPWRVLRFAAQVLLRQLVCIQMFSTWIQQEQLTPIKDI